MNSLRHIFVKIWGPDSSADQPESETEVRTNTVKKPSESPSKNTKSTTEQNGNGVQSIRPRESNESKGSPQHADADKSPVWWPMVRRKRNYAPDNERFFFKDGSVAASLEDLTESIKDMSEEQFAEHTGGESNDFAVWVRDVLQDNKAAALLRYAKNRREAIKVIHLSLTRYDD